MKLSLLAKNVQRKPLLAALEHQYYIPSLRKSAKFAVRLLVSLKLRALLICKPKGLSLQRVLRQIWRDTRKPLLLLLSLLSWRSEVLQLTRKLKDFPRYRRGAEPVTFSLKEPSTMQGGVVFASRKSTSNSSNEATSILLRVHYIDSRSTGRHYIYTMLAFKARKGGSFGVPMLQLRWGLSSVWMLWKKTWAVFLSYRFLTRFCTSRL